MPPRVMKNIIISKVLIAIMVTFFTCMNIGCSIERKDGDVYEASGTYIYDNVSGKDVLFLLIDETDFPEDCTIKKTLLQSFDVKVYSDTLEMPQSSSTADIFDHDTEWEKEESDENDGTELDGTWVLDEKDVEIEITFDSSDYTFKLRATDYECNELDGSEDEDSFGEDQEYTDVDGKWDITLTHTSNSLNNDLEEKETVEMTLTKNGDTFTLDDGTDVLRGVTYNNNYVIYMDEDSEKYKDEFVDNTLATKITFKMESSTFFTGDKEVIVTFNEEYTDGDGNIISTVTDTYELSGEKQKIQED